MVTTHFDLISGPLRVPRGPKGVIWAQSLNFHGPIFLGIPFVPNIGLWGVQTVAAGWQAHPALRRSSEGPGGADLVPTAPEGPAEVEHMVTTLFGLISSP